MTRFAVHAALAAAGLAGACALSACVVQPALVGGCPAAPAVQPETIPPPPPSGESQTWQPGHWNYADGQFVWEPGHYIPTGPGHGGWIPGTFAPGPAGPCTWVPAHWVS